MNIKNLILAISTILLAGLTSKSYAITPEGCFEFNEAQGMITDYLCVYNKDVVIPEQINGVAVTEIGPWAFFNNGITKVKIPNSVIHIGSNAFYKNNLTNVEFPRGLISIGAWAFYKNKITTLAIPSSVTHIGTGAFNRNQIVSLQIPNRDISIEDFAFTSNRMTNIQVPQNARISRNAFAMHVEISYY